MSHMKEERDAEVAKPSEGDTVTAQGENQAPKARMPHERDESADSQSAQAPSTQRIGQIAHDDVVEGQPDTERGPVMDAAYERQKDGEKQRRQ
jgi:hypothetical protein